MEEKKYDFEILFRKLDESRTEQDQIKESDLDISNEVNKQISELKKYFSEPISETKTYTRS